MDGYWLLVTGCWLFSTLLIAFIVNLKPFF
jgi:hypothetical protein